MPKREPVKFEQTSKFFDLEKITTDDTYTVGAVKKKLTTSINNFCQKDQLISKIRHRIPAITWISHYKIKEYLPPDLLAGFTVGIMNIPQSMGYALLATLMPVNGLYMAFFPLIMYSFFGTSRHLAIGSIAVVSLLTGASIDKMLTTFQPNSTDIIGQGSNETGNETSINQIEAYKVTVACTLALLVGIVQFVIGLVGLGFVTSYMSDTFISSYTSGSAIHVLMSQLASLSSSLVILVVIIWIGPLFEPLPKACLASIIVVALKGLILQIRELFKLWKVNKYEFVIWLITYLSVVILDVDIGLIIGIAVSIFAVIVHDQSIRLKELVYGKKSSHLQITTNINYVKMKIFQVQSSLYFANCETFVKLVYASFGKSPIEDKSEESKTKSPSDDKLKSKLRNKVSSEPNSSEIQLENKDNDVSLVLDMTAINYIDTNGMKSLIQLITDYNKINIDVYIVNPQDNLIKLAFNMDLLGKIDHLMYPSIDLIEAPDVRF